MHLKTISWGRIGGQCRLALGSLCHASSHTGWPFMGRFVPLPAVPLGIKAAVGFLSLGEVHPFLEFSSFRLLRILSSLMHFLKLRFLACLSVFVVMLGTVVTYNLLPPKVELLLSLLENGKKNTDIFSDGNDISPTDAFYLLNFVPIIRIYFLRYEKVTDNDS